MINIHGLEQMTHRYLCNAVLLYLGFIRQYNKQGTHSWNTSTYTYIVQHLLQVSVFTTIFTITASRLQQLHSGKYCFRRKP